MSDTVTPQGVIAVCRQFPVSIESLLAGSPKLIAILEEVRDPGNAGTIIRAADAAGADGVILTGRSVDAYNPKVVRSTTGSIFHLPIAQGVELDAAVAAVKAAGIQVLAADIKGDDLPDAARDARRSRPRGCSATRRTASPRVAGARRPRGQGADLRPRRVDESRHGGLRLPVRERLRPALSANMGIRLGVMER